MNNENPKVASKETKVPVNSALFNNLHKKSLDQGIMIVRDRKQYGVHKKLMDLLKKVTCAFVTSAVVSVSAYSIVSMVNEFNKEKEMRVIYQDASSIVHENKHLTEDKEHYWVDYYKIAEGLATLDGDFNINIYGVFNSVGWNDESTIDQMNTIIRYCNQLEITDYNNFEDLCRQNGYCDKDGKVDLKKYRESMREYIENTNTNEETNTIKR